MARARPASELFAIADGVQIGSITQGTSTWNSYPVAWWINSDIIAQDPRTFARENWFVGHKNTPIGVTNTNFDAGGGTPPSGDIRYRQRRNTAANFLFVDGHAETIRRGELMNGQVRPARYENQQPNVPF